MSLLSLLYTLSLWQKYLNSFCVLQHDKTIGECIQFQLFTKIFTFEDICDAPKLCKLHSYAFFCHFNWIQIIQTHAHIPIYISLYVCRTNSSSIKIFRWWHCLYLFVGFVYTYPIPSKCDQYIHSIPCVLNSRWCNFPPSIISSVNHSHCDTNTKRARTKYRPIYHVSYLRYVCMCVQ